MRLPWQKKSNHIPGPGITRVVEDISYNVYSISETGPTRTGNEDSITWLYPAGNKQVVLAMVADGMGGHNAGEVASNLACSVAEHFIESGVMRHNITGMLQALFQQIHTTILEQAQQNMEYNGMGTTAALVFIQDGQLVFGHVGDSRVYRYNNNVLTQLSTDHTLVNKMIREGKLHPGDAETSNMKHLLLQALGTAEKIEPEIGNVLPLQKDDYYFLCSDGLYDVLSHAEISALLSMRQPVLIMECIRSLCYDRKAQDNFSALLVEVIARPAVSLNAITREQNIML